LDGEALAVAPLGPRADVVAYPRVAEHAQHQPGVGRAVAALAVGDHLTVAVQAELRVQRSQVGRRLQAARLEIVDPFERDRARHPPAARGADLGAVVLAGTSRVDNLGAGVAEARQDVLAGRDLLGARARPKRRARHRARLGADRIAGGAPGAE